ncbi:MAG: XisI protein [Hormoscilla sp. SP5CHS1]|nr:XisI protein [Hormoscilla sp. SP12CHS1]MBC6455040.1 XisI protein [Hormoscilla sp. SP5CHS1]
MEKLEAYRHCIQELLLDYSQHKPAHGEIEVETIFDVERNHYQIVYLGWERQTWIHSCIIHLDIKDEKIWIQWNATEIDLAAELVARGVDNQDIVIGFHSPFMRKFTPYAVG